MEENRFKPMVPLVIFSVMVLMGAGLIMPLFVLTYFQLGGAPWLGEFMVTIVVLTGLGIAVSLLHLGKKARMLRAAFGLGHSWLSREVLAAGLYMAAVALTLVLLETGRLSFRMLQAGLLITFILALMLAMTIGKVYRLEAQPGWKGLIYSISPLFNALLVGAVFFVFLSSRSTFLLAFYPVWAIDFVLGMLRALRFTKSKETGAAFGFPHMVNAVRNLHVVRVTLSVLLLPSMVFFLYIPALLALLGVIVADRFCFFAGMVQPGPKSEIAELKKKRMASAAQTPVCF